MRLQVYSLCERAVCERAVFPLGLTLWFCFKLGEPYFKLGKSCFKLGESCFKLSGFCFELSGFCFELDARVSKLAICENWAAV